jgi:integrase
MTSPSYLTTSSRNVYYFRFPIPQSLHPEGKQSTIRLSLQTRCPKQALQVSRAMSYAGIQLLHNHNVIVMDYQDIRDTLFDHFKAMREGMKQRINTHGRLTTQDKAALANNKANAVAALQADDFSIVGTDDELGDIIDAYAIPINKGTDHYNIMRVEFLKAFRDYCDSVIEYDSRFEGFNFKTDPASLAMRQATKRTAKKKLADVLDDYIEEKLRLKQWRENVAAGYRSQFELLLNYLGEDTSLHMSDDVARDVKAMLLKLPANINKKKKLQGKPVAELIKLDGYERLSPITVNKYLSSYSSFYNWAMKRKQIADNPFAPLIDDVKQVRQERDHFTPEQSKQIIAEVMKAPKPHHKWGVLIAFYTGARLNEIAQLDVADIRQVENVWCIDINENGEFKRLKNKASRRVVPIHSKLIEYGLLDYAKQAGEGRLFPSLTFDKQNGYGKNLGRWFNESLLPNLDMKSGKLVFHSIRHTVADKLRNAGVELSTIKDIIGHTQGDITIDVYASKLHKGLMQKAVEILEY